MKVVDDGRKLPNGQAQGSSGLNTIPIKAESEVREQLTLDIVYSVHRPSSLFLHIAISHITFVFFCYHLSY